MEGVERGSRGVGIQVLSEREGGYCSVIRAKEILEEEVECVDVLVRPLVD